MPASTAPNPSAFNAADYFVDRHLREGRADNIAIECGDERISYAQLAERVNRLGRALRDSLSVRMEERVVLLLPDVPEFAYCFFGAIKIGAVPVPLNTLLRSNDYEYLLNDTRVRVAVVHETLSRLILQIPRERLPFLQHIVVVGSPPPETISFSELLAAHAGQLTAAPTCKDDAAFWLYSSGSTGAPKACIHLQHDMLAATEQYACSVLQIRESDRFFSAAKLFFAYGLGNALYFPFAVGATAILCSAPPSPQHVFTIIERHHPTLFFSTPSGIAALTEFRREARECTLSSVRLAVSAGESLPAVLYERFAKRFSVELLDGIGSTEALHIFISNYPGEVRPGSAGRVLRGCEAKILDENHQPVPTGEIGNLWLKSDAVCAAYWNSHERSKQVIHGHWISTGDKFYQDADGYYWFAGRSDDMLKVSGVWVSPLEVEKVLLEHEAVAETAVVGYQDKDSLTKPVAWVVLREGFTESPALASALLEFVVARLPVYKRPRKIQFVKALPRTATGKVRRFELRQTPVDP
ncbi:MAG TPA: benzoate-CoA ligase family protein [Candidatus Acidoferrum sp.]|nr:benzoate-CoA ligase family protein [Candidatus Acidoferrum sp.]